MLDYYNILNATIDTTPEVLKDKYKRRLRKYHPDKTSDPESKKKLELVKEAYSILSNPYSKGRYDVEYEKRFINNKSVDTFNGVFDELSGMPNIKLPANFSEVIKKFPINQQNYSMNSFSSSSVTGKDGKLHTKRNFTTNNNGKKKSYYQEFTTDKSGKIKIIKQIGTKPKLKSLKDIKD